MSDCAKIFGGNLNQLLKQKNVTRKTLAENLKTTQATIGRYINGEREPPLDKIFEIAEFLKVPVSVLIGDNRYCGDGSKDITSWLKDRLEIEYHQSKRFIEFYESVFGIPQKEKENPYVGKL